MKDHAIALLGACAQDDVPVGANKVYAAQHCVLDAPLFHNKESRKKKRNGKPAIIKKERKIIILQKKKKNVKS